MIFSRLSVWAAVLAMLSTTLVGATTAADEADEQVVEWLDRLEERGRELETLTASVSHAQEEELLGDKQIRMGKVWYAAADPEEDEPARFAVHFDRIVIDDALREQHREFIFDGEWLVEKDHRSRLFQRRQVVAPGEQFNPLEVDGPFPLPIGQKRDEVLGRFHVEIIDDEDPDREHLVHLRLKPREDVPRQQGEPEFEVIDMWFDRETLLPERVETQERSKKTIVALYEQEVDTLSEDEMRERFDTTLPERGEGWRVEITPYEQ